MNMRIEDFIEGTELEKEQFAALISSAAFAFFANLLKTCYEFQDELPDEMIKRISGMLEWFHSYVGEFLDVDSFVQTVARAMIEEENNDTTA